MSRKFITAFFLIVTLCWGHKVFASSSGSDFPVNKPSGDGYTNGEVLGPNEGWGFLEWNGSIWHPGEDWNRGAGETDYGDPVYSVADGVVICSKDFRMSWGKVVLIEHDISGQKVYSQYAHLSQIGVQPGSVVSKGERIGAIGNANNAWASHLHFEIRKTALSADFWPSGMAKEQVAQKYYNPTDFINSHRAPKAAVLTATAGQGQANLSWTKSEDPQFERYEVYRSSISGGTLDAGKRTLFLSTAEAGSLSAIDDKAPIGVNYYRVISYFKNGLTADSAEVSVENKREVTQVTSNTYYQGSPAIIDGRVFFEDTTPSGNNANRTLNYYDLGTKKLGNVSIPLDMTYVYVPSGSSQKVAYYSYNRNGCYRVYYYNFANGQNFPASIGDSVCSQVNPDISDSGKLVWQQIVGGKYRVYLNDTSGSAGPTRTTSFDSSQINPRIDGDNLIWKDSRSSKSYDIYLKNLSTGEESKLASDTGDGRAEVWGKYVVWEDKGKVTLINIETKEQKVITASGAGYNPTVNEGKAVYTLLEGTTSYVHVFDIDTGVDAKIDTPLHAMSYPVFGSGYVAWDDTPTWPSADKNIFLTKL